MISQTMQFDFEDEVEAIRARLVRGIEDAAVDAALRRSGYVKPVMCRDCACFEPDAPIPGCTLLDFGADDQAERGFCAWGVERGGA